MKLKLSVIIPAYNVENYIERCIESVCNQTEKNLEIIVVNDGSTDKTKKKLEKFQKKDKRIIVINKVNGGLSSARNAGINIAKGEYICHLDGDDWIEKTAYEKMLNLAIEKNLDIVISDYYDDYDNKKIVKNYDIKLESKIYSGEDYLKEYFAGKGVSAIWNKIYKTDLYIKYRIKHPEKISIGEDLETLSKLLLNAKRISKINESFVHYIQNPNSMTRNKIALKFKDLINVFENIENYFKEQQKYQEYKVQILQYKIIHFSNFIFYPSYWKNKEYIENVNYIINFFSKKDVKENLIILDGFRKNFYRLEYYFKSKKLIYIINKIIILLKKIKK
ncbi:MAG: glycosyltransferase family 2 protein [Fusobacteriaceae bacterium]